MSNSDTTPARTPLYEAHVAAGGKMVDFAGWMMPVNYGSQIEEHVAVRTDAGMFDVSHMTVIDLHGAGAEAFLRRLVANDVAKLSAGQALYGALLNDQGGVLDDLIVYRTAPGFRAVVNASTRDKVLAWFAQHADSDVSFAHTPGVMIAVQGPNAIAKVQQVLNRTDLADLAPFHSQVAAHEGVDCLLGRTGYTGEDGVEIMLPAAAPTDCSATIIVPEIASDSATLN